jgi:hypothetical protein
MAITLNALQKQRRDTASNWTSNNTVLLAGEIGWETDTRKIKIGDGTTAWQSLDYLPIPDVNRLLTGNLTVGGNFTVNGTTTTIDTTTLTVEDKNIEIGKVSSPSDTTADGGGLTLLGSTNKTFNWLDATDSWTSSENIAIPDNKKFTAGDSQDLQIYHNTNSYIDNSTGITFIRNTGTNGSQIQLLNNNSGLKIQGLTGEQSIIANANGSVELYHNNVKKAETSADGLDLPDMSKLQLGDSQDLQIFHSGNHSFIKDTGNGSLFICTNSFQVNNAAANESIIVGNQNGAVELYHDNVKKIETSADGVNLPDNSKLQLGDSQDLQIYHDSIASYIADTGQGVLKLLTDGFRVRNGADNENIIKGDQNGAVELYYDNVKKIETSANGVDVTGNIAVSGTISGTLANGVVATTQSASDNSTKVATTAYVDNQVSAGGSGISNVVEDTTPQLGGNLDMQSNNITGTGNINTTGQIGRDSNDYIAFTDDTQLDVYINGNNEFRFEADGDFHADGDVIAESTTIASDEKLKENINLIINPIEKIKQIRGVTFDWKRDGKKSAGVIAQDIEKILPEAVKEVQGLKDDESYKTVNYNSLISILVESVKELTARVEELEAK